MNTLFLALFVAVPVVLLTSAFMFFIRKGRKEDPSKEVSAEKDGAKGLWIVTGLLALVFAGAGFPKLGTVEMVLTSFEEWGYPQWFHYAVGAVEFIGAILLLIPSTATLSALILCGVMVGAAVTHGTAGEWTMLPVNVLLFVGLAYVGWARAGELVGSASNTKGGAEVAAA